MKETGGKMMPLRMRKYIQNKIISKQTMVQTEKKKEVFDYRILTNPAFRISIVYFANLFVNPSYGPRLIREQLMDLITTGVARMSRVHIVLSVPEDFDHSSFQNMLTLLFQKEYRTLIFHINNDNCHEYPGIQRVHSLALEEPSSCHYILYFHSKGITRFHGRRERTERALHSTVIAPWKDILQIFETHPQIDKVGSSASTGGWIWWNYWWARASYLVQVEKPVKTERRHYYEDWLCRVFVHPEDHQTSSSQQENCFQTDLYRHDTTNCWSLSIHDQPIGEGCEPQEAQRILVEGLR